MKKIIYADNAATTKLHIGAFEAMKPFLLEEYANPSQPYSFSRKAKQAIKKARKDIADCIGANPEQIYFTSGGTESNNWVIKKFGNVSCKRQIITSVIEHNAILNPCKKVKDVNVKYLPVDNLGFVSKGNLQFELIQNDVTSSSTRLVSVMMANNEIGTIEPIEELCKISHEYQTLFHTDAVQAVGHIPIDVRKLGIDFLSASSHKFNGPKGIGFLYCDNKDIITPYEDGGYQEFGMRAGTENVAAIVGMAESLKWNIENMEKNTIHLNKLSEIFLDKIKNVDYVLNGDPLNRLPGNVNISICGLNGETLLHRLDLKGICISTGSACDSTSMQISHVIKAISTPNEYANGTIRITFGHENTESDAYSIANEINNIISI